MYRSAYKSPRSTPQASRERIREKETRLAVLRARLEDLQAQYTHKETPEQVVCHHVAALNQFNGVKDAALAMVALIAVQRGTTITAVLADFGVDPEEE